MIVLYSNNCPNCRLLKKMLDKNDIEYTENNSVDEMLALGLTNVPALKVGDDLLPFNEAVAYIQSMED